MPMPTGQLQSPVPVSDPASGAPRIRPFPEARHVPLELIDPNPDQPRRELLGIEDLAAHVRRYGVLQPVVLTPAPDGRYTLVAGHRRVAALRWLARHDTAPGRWRDVPAVVRDVATADRLALALAENVSRHALADAEVLTALRLLLDLNGWSQAELARRLGVSPQWVSQFARVLADPELAAHVQTGRLSAAKAYEVQRAAAPARPAALQAALGGASLRAIRHIAERGAATPAESATVGQEAPALAQSSGSVPEPVDSASASHPRPSRREGRAPAPSHTVPVSSDWTPAADTPGPLDDESPVSLATLAVHALLQEARRRRLTTLPASALRAALCADLRALGRTLAAAAGSPAPVPLYVSHFPPSNRLAPDNK